VQHTLTLEKQKAVVATLHLTLKSSQKILVASANNPPANALLRAFPSPPFKLTDGEFTTGLLLRFGLPVLEGLKAIFRGRSTLKVEPCPVCGLPISEGHERNCKKSSRRLLSERHSRVRTVLYYLFRSIPGVAVRSEQRSDIDPAKDAEDPDDGASVSSVTSSRASTKLSKAKQAAIQPDLSFTLLSCFNPAAPSSSSTTVRDTTAHFIDLTVGDPLAAYHAARALTGGVPAFLEGVKIKKYQPWLVNNPGRFWPAGFTSLGQLGPQAAALIDFLAAHCKREEIPFPRGFWMSRIGVVLWRYLHKMQCTWAHAASRAHPSTANSTMPDSAIEDAIDPNLDLSDA
jgi:predicted nucleic acid-binding Zn ribbon protein